MNLDISMEDFNELNIEEMRFVKNKRIESQLEEIVNLINECKSFELCLELKSIYEKLLWCAYDGERVDFFRFTHLMLIEYIFRNKKSTTSEEDVHKWFEMNFDKIIMDGKIIKHEYVIKKGKYRADYLCEVYGMRTIVEIKKGTIDKKALRQIKNYMKNSKSPFGILIGRELEVELPEEILFISYKDKTAKQ